MEKKTTAKKTETTADSPAVKAAKTTQTKSSGSKASVQTKTDVSMPNKKTTVKVTKTTTPVKKTSQTKSADSKTAQKKAPSAKTSKSDYMHSNPKDNTLVNEIGRRVRTIDPNPAHWGKPDDENIRILTEVYQNSSYERQALSSLIEKAENGDFKNELLKSYSRYDEICGKSAAEIVRLGEKPKERNVFNKMYTWGSVNISTLIDNSQSKIADVVIRGCTDGLTSVKKALNQNHTNDLDSAVTKIANSYVNLQHDSINSMFRYL